MTVPFRVRFEICESFPDRLWGVAISILVRISPRPTFSHRIRLKESHSHLTSLSAVSDLAPRGAGRYAPTLTERLSAVRERVEWGYSARHRFPFTLRHGRTPASPEPRWTMGVPTYRFRLARHSPVTDSLLADLLETSGGQTRQEACVVPRTLPVEQGGVGHSESNACGDCAPCAPSGVQTRVREAGTPALSERASASRAG